MSELEKAWAAGFFDGEGCIHAHRSGNGRRYPRLQVTQVHEQPLVRFAAAVETGKVLGPYEPKASQKRPYWLFVATNMDEVLLTLGAIGPYISAPKLAQALEVCCLCSDAFEANPARRNIRDPVTGQMTKETVAWLDSPATVKLKALSADLQALKR